MALTRRDTAFRTEWEVDHSGLAVYRLKGGSRWLVKALFFQKPEGGYLTRNGLEGRRFATRAHAVDAIRITLASDPRHSPPLTRWRKQAEGIYHSTDGHWKLSRTAGFQYRLTPRSKQAERALEHDPSQRVQLGWSSSTPHTLNQCAERVDLLNRDLWLEIPGGGEDPSISW